LTHLNLHGALITTYIDSSCFECTTYFKVLNISSIKIAEKHLDRFGNTRVQTLNFRNLTKLETLDLSDAQSDGIVELNEDTFRNSSQIKYLYMKKIGAKTVNYTSLPKALWSKLSKPDLSDNPYVCDCDSSGFNAGS